MDNTTALRDSGARSQRSSAPLDVLVVGAGQAGLAMAWHLAQRRMRYLLVDAAPEIGHSWRSRWDTLKLFSPAQYDGLPGMDFPAPADTYPTKDQVADFLGTYAERHSLPVLTGTRVHRLEPHYGGFAAHTSQGVLTARQVVVATGPFQKPFVPRVEGTFGVPQLHSSAYRRPGDLPTGRILVVGGANSGLQIAQELATSRQVVLSSGSNPPAVPQRPLGRDLFWWLTRLGVMEKGSSSRLAKRMRARGDLVIGTSRRALRGAGVEFRPRLLSAQQRSATFTDGSCAEVDGVVWATGFRPDYSWIDVPGLTDAAGVPHHDAGRSVVAEGLWFLGLPWQRTRGSALLGFVQRDAEYLDASMFDRAAAG
ncbi:MAG TPA: NAD(P)/FAD-dependent oxidoreductase [Mycobacterium sp.]|jgi:putative flavoprotein involved in K+ transport|nr:NAD(P)/FAD-dependent oxidoreductase [Mycobacterium sp.]